MRKFWERQKLFLKSAVTLPEIGFLTSRLRLPKNQDRLVEPERLLTGLFTQVQKERAVRWLGSSRMNCKQNCFFVAKDLRDIGAGASLNCLVFEEGKTSSQAISLQMAGGFIRSPQIRIQTEKHWR